MSDFAKFCVAFCAWIIGFTILGWLAGYTFSDDGLFRSASAFAAGLVGFNATVKRIISTTKHTQGEG